MATERRVLAADGGVLCGRCLVADRPLARMRGLLGRRTLPCGEGLLLRPASSIHTWAMRFPIDAVFLDRELVVLRVESGLEPWRTAWRRGAAAVLELAAGECARRGVAQGTGWRGPRRPMLSDAASISGHDAHKRRTWLTALVSAPLAAFCIRHFGAGADALVPVLLVPVLVLLSIIDLEERRIPNRVVLPATAVVLALQLATQSDRALEWLLAPLAAAVFLLLPLLVYPGGMGMGDVKLALLLGAALDRQSRWHSS